MFHTQRSVCSSLRGTICSSLGVLYILNSVCYNFRLPYLSCKYDLVSRYCALSAQGSVYFKFQGSVLYAPSSVCWNLRVLYVPVLRYYTLSALYVSHLGYHMAQSQCTVCSTFKVPYVAFLGYCILCAHSNVLFLVFGRLRHRFYLMLYNCSGAPQVATWWTWDSTLHPSEQ